MNKCKNNQMFNFTPPHYEYVVNGGLWGPRKFYISGESVEQNVASSSSRAASHASFGLSEATLKAVHGFRSYASSFFVHSNKSN